MGIYSQSFCWSFKPCGQQALLKQLTSERVVRMVVTMVNSNFQYFIQQILNILSLDLHRKFLIFLLLSGIRWQIRDVSRVAVVKQGRNHCFANNSPEKTACALNSQQRCSGWVQCFPSDVWLVLSFFFWGEKTKLRDLWGICYLEEIYFSLDIIVNKI